jgi:hypothetical protein
MIFESICLIHIFIWVFVLLAFFSVKTAKINLYFIIPAIYLIHILPFHILTESKKSLDPEHWEENMDNFLEDLVIPKKFVDLQNKLEKQCFASPISPQGMLLFGAISCSYKLLIN